MSKRTLPGVTGSSDDQFASGKATGTFDRVQHPPLYELVVAFQHAEMQLMNVKVVELMSVVEDGPFLDAVWLNFDHRCGRAAHRVGLDNGIRAGYFRDVKVGLAVSRSLILSKCKGPSAHGYVRRSRVIDALRCRSQRNRSVRDGRR